MSAATRRIIMRGIWVVAFLTVTALVSWDLAYTAAKKTTKFIDPLAAERMYVQAPNQNAIVAVCQSTDAALGALAAPLSVDLTDAQVDSMTRLAVQRAGGFDNVVAPGDWVVVKPNILAVPGLTGGMSWQHRGTVTDLRAVKSVIQQLLEEGDASRITVIEGKVWRKMGEAETPPEQTYDGWTYHWPWYGNLSYHDMLAEFEAATPTVTVDYIDLDYPPYTPGVPVPGGGFSADAYTVPNAILQCDKLIGMAVMKTHTLARVTLVSKLYVGTSPASVYRTGYWDHFGIDHGHIDRTLVDLESYHPPDFGLVVGTWGTQGAGPLGGSEIRRNVILASRDPVAVDAASAYAMGFNPWDIDHLHWAHYKGFGIQNLDYIDVVGPPLDAIRYNFAKAKGQGRGNRAWLVNGTYPGSDIDADYLGGVEPTVSPLEGDITNGHTWTAFGDVTDYMDLAVHYGAPSNCYSYAFTRVVADSALSARLRFGSDDGIKIWLNGTVIYTNNATGGWSAVQTDLPITLQAGVNRLLVKIRNTTGAYGFSVYVCETDGDTPLATEYTLLGGGAPMVSLNAPPDGEATADSFVVLSASVSDPEEDSLTVSFQCDQTDASAPQFVQERVASGSTIEHRFTRSVLQPDASTIGLWHFDEGTGGVLHDASGNGQHGYWHCDSTLDEMWDTEGPFGHAVHCSGFRTPTPDNPCAADYVEVPPAPIQDVDPSSQLSIEFWVRPDQLPLPGERYWGIISKRIPCLGADTVTCSTPANYEVFFNHPTQTLGFYGNSTLYVGTCALTVGQWQYIAVTVDGPSGRLRFYKNGVLVQQMTGYIGNTISGPMRFGASAYRRKGVDGVLDEVRISRRELDSVEIRRHFQRAVGTYLWTVTADDGTTATTTPVRQFTLASSGPDPNPPLVSLLAPANGATTNHPYMDLSAQVTDESPTVARIFGGSSSNPQELLYTEGGLVGTQTINYQWRGRPFVTEPGVTAGLWHMNEGVGSTTADVSGNGLTGTLLNGPTWVPGGRFGAALSFDGTNDYVNVPHNPTLSVDSATGALTMEAWVYPTVSGGDGLWRTILSKSNMGSAAVNYRMSLDRVTGNLLFYSGRYPEIWISSVHVPAGEWSYVAVSLSAAEGKLRFYKNGVALDSTAAGSAWFGPALTSEFHIGVSMAASESFVGMIDEVRLTRRVLASTEVASHYELGDGVYYWKVAATDSINSETESEVRSFTVNRSGGPSAPVLLSPANGAVIADNTPTMQWSATAGTGGTYTLEYALDAGFTMGKVVATGIPSTSYTAPSALADDTYYWHVQAFDSGGDSSGYQVTPFAFTVSTMVDTEPPVITLLAPADHTVTTERHVQLLASVSDASPPMTVGFYGGRTSPPTGLLHVEQGVGNLANVAWDHSSLPLEPQAPYTMGLWHFDDNYGTTAGDVSGYGHAATFAGTPLWTAGGRFGYALDFGGVAEGDYLVVPDDASLDISPTAGQITMEAWVYPRSVGGGVYRTIVAKRGFGTGGGPCNYQMSLNNANGHLLFYNGTNIYVSSVPVPANEWSHVAVTLSATEGRLRFYLNGAVRDTSITGATFGAVHAYPLYVAVANVVGECFDGLLDEIRITSRVLSAAEIAAEFQLAEGDHYWSLQGADSHGNSALSVTRHFTVVSGTGPAVPVLRQPPNLSLVATNTPTFAWSATAGTGGTYTLQYSTSANFSAGTVTVAGLADTNHAVPAPAALADGAWYWHVQAYNQGGVPSGYQATPFSFTVDTQAPAVPALYSPVDSAILRDATPAFAWSATAGSGGSYTLAWSATADFSSGVVTHSGLADTTYTPADPDALADGVWYWHVEALDLAGHHSGFQAARTFTLDTQAPAIPALVQPAQGAVLADLTPEFVWRSTAGMAGRYTLQVAPSSDFSTGVIQVSDLADTTHIVPAGSPLALGTWYWHVRATDQAGNVSGYAATPNSFTLTVLPPDIPLLQSPPDLALLNDQTPTLVWSATAGPQGSYTLEYGVDSLFGYAITVSGITEATATVSIPLADGTYYWRVKARNQAGMESAFQTHPFRFSVDGAVPAPPVLISPPNRSFTCSCSPTFVWSSSVTAAASQDRNTGEIAGGAAGVTYTLQYATDSLFQNVLTESGLTETSYRVTGADTLSGAQYFWRVRAVDGAGNSSGYQAVPFRFGRFLAGDQNQSDNITSSDLIRLVNFTFKGGDEPLPCEAAGDVNCDLRVTSADIILLVNFVFKGGTPPCDLGALISSGTWSCP